MLIGSRRVTVALMALFVVAGESLAGTVSGNVADYNAAEVRLTNGALVVPAGVATYTATTLMAIGSSFTVTLPAGFTFSTVPSLTTSGTSTFALSAGGVGAQSATFTVATSALSSGQTISLASFNLNGATALETVTPVANALPLTMQSIGNDASPVSFRAFASDVGAQAVFVGAIQFIDLNPPSDGTEFLGPPDSLSAVISAIAIEAQTTDAATGTVPILGTNGLANTLLNTDTATVTIAANFAGISQAFSSSNSTCTSPISSGTVNPGSITIPNVPINVEVFFCEIGSGAVLGSDPNGFTNLTVSPGSSTDFLSFTNVNVEYPGLICYALGAFDCVTLAPPTFSKAFGAATLFLSSPTTLTFTVGNSNSVGLTGITFSDSLPAGLVVANPPGVADTCGGTVTAAAGTASISLAGGTITAGSTCTVVVNVAGKSPGPQLNITSLLTTYETTAAPEATASINVFLALDTPFQVSYAADPSAGESYVNIINTGASGAPPLGPGLGAATGNTCVNVYALDPSEELVACCSCLLTPNQVMNLGVNADLTVKTETGVVPPSVTIKLVNTLAGPTGAGTSCTSSAASAGAAGFPLAQGMVAYGTTPQAVGPIYNQVEHPFIPSTLSAGELASLTGRCSSIIGNASGYGICLACRSGALGATKE